MSAADYLPKSRRDFANLLGGVGVAFGLMTIPGLTVESEETTDLRNELIETKANLGFCSMDVESKKGEIDRCWSRARNAGARATDPGDEP